MPAMKTDFLLAAIISTVDKYRPVIEQSGALDSVVVIVHNRSGGGHQSYQVQCKLEFSDRVEKNALTPGEISHRLNAAHTTT